MFIAGSPAICDRPDSGPLARQPGEMQRSVTVAENTNWEGAYRVPAMIRWPGHIRAGQVSNEIFAALDWFPTLLAAAGEPDIKSKLLAGHNAAGKTFKVHLDGYNQLPLLTGPQEKSPRKEFFYINDDAELVAMRYENWKVVFCEQKVQGTLEIWAAPFVCRRLPKMFNLRFGPYERADITSNTYYDWSLQRSFLVVPAQAIVQQLVRRSGTSRRGRGLRASASIRSWSKCRGRMAASDHDKHRPA
jgi:arylsulfatase